MFIRIFLICGIGLVSSTNVNLPNETKQKEVEIIKEEFSKLLEFGNNEYKLNPQAKEPKKPCKHEPEDEFYEAISNTTNFDHIFDEIDKRKENISFICNRFKYFTCDNNTGNCVCIKNLEWYPTNITSPKIFQEFYQSKNRSEAEFKNLNTTVETDFGRYNGSCRIELKVPNSCFQDAEKEKEFKESLKKPFSQTSSHQDIFKLFDNSTIEPIPNAKCNFEHKWYECGESDCRDTKSIFLDEFQLLEYYFLIYHQPTSSFTSPCKSRDDCEEILTYGQRKPLHKNTNELGQHIQHSVTECDTKLQHGFRRSPNESFSWDFSKIREIVINGSTGGHCSPFTFQECYNGICICPRGDKNLFGKTDIYTMDPTTWKCVPKEGVHCTRYFWYNGKWVEYNDKCGDDNLNCILAPDKMNEVCCNEEEMKKKIEENGVGYSLDDTDRGRCRNARRPKAVSDDYMEYHNAAVGKSEIGAILILYLYFTILTIISGI